MRVVIPPEKQKLIAALSIAMVTVLIIIASMIGTKKQQARKADTKFRVEEGKARKNAQPIVSSKQQENEREPEPETPSESVSEETKAETEPKVHASPALVSMQIIEDCIEEALTELAPADALVVLNEQLDKTDDPDEKSRVNAALAVLHVRAEPPDVIAAQMALFAAQKQAKEAASRYFVARMAGESLVRAGGVDDACVLMAKALQDDDAVVLQRIQLESYLCSCLMKNEKPELAMQGYEMLLNEIEAYRSSLGDESVPIYRNAGLRLARLYREAGRDLDAERLGRRARFFK